jgi:GNAT superfamily N-acetyltransferase
VIEIRTVRGDDPEAVAMLRAMEDWVLESLGPTTPDKTSTVTPGEMVPPSGAFVLVTEDRRPLAGGGVRRLPDGAAEVKRMFVLPEARGRGLGRRLLDALEAAAAELGYDRVRLDTAATMPVAMEMYRRAGYEPIPDYNGNTYAAFWGEKRLTR